MTVFRPFDFPLTLPAALVVIDMQPCGVDPEYGLAKSLETTQPGFTSHLTERVRTTVVPAINELKRAFHNAGQDVYFTAFASQAGDGSDIRTATINYRHAQRLATSGSPVILPRSDPATNILAALAPGPRDTILTKTSMDTFATTTLAESLRRTGVASVVLGGVYTDACVESTARSAAELGYRVFVAHDACAAWEPAFHDASLQSLARYFARIEASADIVRLLAEAQGNVSGAGGTRAV